MRSSLNSGSCFGPKVTEKFLDKTHKEYMMGRKGYKIQGKMEFECVSKHTNIQFHKNSLLS